MKQIYLILYIKFPRPPCFCLNFTPQLEKYTLPQKCSRNYIGPNLLNKSMTTSRFLTLEAALNFLLWMEDDHKFVIHGRQPCFHSFVATEENNACTLSKLYLATQLKTRNKRNRNMYKSLCALTSCSVHCGGDHDHILPHPGLLVLVHHQALKQC